MTTREARVVAGKEWKLLRDQFGGTSWAGFAVVGLFLGLTAASAYLSGEVAIASPAVLLTYPLIAASVAIQPVVESFAGERERHTLETLLATPLSDRGILAGKMAAAFVPAVGFALLLFAFAVGAANVFAGADEIILPPAWIGVGTVVLVFAMAGLVSTGGVLVSMRSASVRRATQTFGFVVVASGLTPTLGFMLLPGRSRASLLAWAARVDELTLVFVVAAPILLLDILFLVMAMRGFRRGALSLD